MYMKVLKVNMNKFQKTYLSIIKQDVQNNPEYIEIKPYNTIKRFLNEQHLKQRGQKRYLKDLNQLELKTLLNKLIDYLNIKNIWFSLPIEGRGFTFHAKWSDVWMSGRIYFKNNEKKIYVSTLLPKNNPKPYDNDLFIELDV